MKGAVVGDYLLPTEISEKIFTGEEIETVVDSSVKTDFVVKTRAEIRNVWRQLEQHGPSGVPYPADLPALVRDAEILVVHICPVNKEILDRAEKLKIILSARGGLENIDIDEATRRKIPVIHAPNHNAQAVAEYTIGLMLAETRNIARSHCALKQGVWQEFYPNSAYIPELNELKIGIIGYGQNGRLVARKLKSFETTIMVCDPFVADEIIIRDGYIPLSLESLLQEADIVSLHVKLTPQNRRMIGPREFAMMKSSTYFINTARSGLVDMEALIHALRAKSIQGAAIDVFDVEPLPEGNPLVELENLTLTNHRAGDTRGSYWNVPDLLRKDLLKYLHGESPQFFANPQVAE
ncbi:MAG: D-3-phosphoglycerate dehydrogenase / 2-oxoglutarate reductase [Verrucomicrobiota bacterium]|nr:D-3-phosphoglycerate dehydrogenase / 2-oxoglutarate reductase [Verrucomicrobiota bacterium]